ncbi:hypothetical protein [Cellulomonas cellasea]|uniref:Uncharacterized protein n=1 Tax=Cellulomonas cellasea TaxID=43670 RepID=A0A7W4UIC0_9CELL|nr:hypothetical protein [Cellulomonas cellasea]MBB2924719.1 hypothetical protein [Cellulomonas cellasea]
MSHRFGVHGELVEAFLDEVRSTEKGVWLRYAELALPSRAVVAAGRALNEVRLPAPVKTALYSASLDAFRSIGLTDDDLPEGVYVSRVAGGIQNAATALAAGESLEAGHRRVLLLPFDQCGFDSVKDAVPSEETS